MSGFLRGEWVRRLSASLVLGAAAVVGAPPAQAADADETEFSKYFETVDVWHAHVEYSVGYSNQDVILTKELTPQPPPAGKLCYIRFDLLEGVGDYAYGFKPATLEGPRREAAWGVYVHKRGNVLNQLRSILKLDAIYFYVDGPKGEDKNAGAALCAQKQAEPTAQAGHAYGAAEWSDLIVRGKLTHGWPAQPPR